MKKNNHPEGGSEKEAAGAEREAGRAGLAEVNPWSETGSEGSRNTDRADAEDPCRCRKSRDVGFYIGARPRRDQSGQCNPQLGITKEGDGYLRTLLVNSAQYILGRFGPDTDLRRGG